ncbi:MAG TPA: hypothetical protein VGC47_05675 [Acidimicrobiia bacterium]|jgi:hypothetical protein
MLLRIRWFTLGVLVTIGLGAYLVAQVRRARERLSPSAIGRAGAERIATALDRAADRIAPNR